jgi:hypothetical protein
MDRIGALLPQLRVKTIPGGNHAMHVDGMEAWVNAVVAECVDAGS